MIGFVDDTTNITSAEPHLPISSLLNRIQYDAQLWYDLIFLSGGNLELEKCGYHIIFYKYDKNDQPVMQRKVEGEITITTKDGDIVPIKQKNIYQSRKNLGHHKSPAQNYKKQVQAILSTADEISTAIGKSGAPRDTAKLYYDTVWIPAVKYTLGQSFLTSLQFKKIDNKVSQLLGQFGYSMRQATEITNAPL